MKFDMMSQKIVSELRTLYELGIGEVAVNTFSQYGRSGLYDNLYDFLIKEGHKIDFDKDTKKQLYQLAIKTFNEERKSWVQSGIMSEEGMKDFLLPYRSDSNNDSTPYFS